MGMDVCPEELPSESEGIEPTCILGMGAVMYLGYSTVWADDFWLRRVRGLVAVKGVSRRVIAVAM